MCEELEYSELLDKASEQSDVYERMVYVAAFAVSSYGSSYYRAGSKPFNPLLGETYECIRDDKGFKFIAEQVMKKKNSFINFCTYDMNTFTFCFRLVIIHQLVYVMLNQKILYFGKMLELRQNFGVNQWSFNQQVC